jgi:hypothetical protein
LLLEEHVLRSLSAIDGALLQVVDLVNEVGLPGMRSKLAWDRLCSLARPLPGTGAIFVYDETGDTVAATPSHPPPVFNASDRAYFKELMSGSADQYIGRALRGRTVHNLFFPVARSIRGADGQVIAVGQVGVEVDYISHLFTYLKLGVGEGFGLYRTFDGAVVARHPMEEHLLDETISSAPFYNALAEDKAPAGRGRHQPGGDRPHACEWRAALPASERHARQRQGRPDHRVGFRRARHPRSQAGRGGFARERGTDQGLAC